MVRIIEAHNVITGEEKYIEYAGLSTDEKPVSDMITTGSVFVEVDTGDAYLFDEESSSWKKVGG